MGSRTTAAEMEAASVAALARALGTVGASVHPSNTRRSDLVAVLPNGQRLVIEVKAASVVDRARAQELIVAASQGTVVVADLISDAGRTVLDEASVSWLDRRGHLRLTTPNAWIDRNLTPLPRAKKGTGRTVAIRGSAAIGVAAGHLIDPNRFSGIRPMAPLLSLSPAAVSKARANLVEHGLIGSDHESRKALFRALSEAWLPTWIDLPKVPSHDHGLVAGGTLAAVARGASIIATRNYPLEIHCSDAGLFERVRLRAGSNARNSHPTARLAIAPTPLVSEPATLDAMKVQGFPTAHPLFVALDLASDPARGEEALTEWEPEGWPRAW